MAVIKNGKKQHQKKTEIKPVSIKFTAKQIEAAKTNYETLTPREKGVALLMAIGLSNKQVAEKLGISTKTNDIHRNEVVRKLDVDAVTGIPLAVLAAHGLVTEFVIG